MAPVEAMTALPLGSTLLGSVQLCDVCDSCGAKGRGGKFCADCGANLSKESSSTAQVVAAGGGLSQVDEDAAKQQVVNQLMQMVQKPADGPKPGLSHEAKNAKELLAKDPYNMEHICDLGIAYAKDEQWEKSANVLLRGWKRAKEITDVQKRFEFLILLTMGSMNLKKYRQALAVLEDIEEPLEFNASALNALKCQVYCANNDAPRGLKAFNDAILGLDFDQALSQWQLCHEMLVKGGLAETTKTLLRDCLSETADKDEEIRKLDMLEAIIEVKRSYKQKQSEPQLSPAVRSFLYILIAVLIAFLLHGLHKLEKMSLDHHRIEL
jgi:hypothetical protein